MQYYSSLGPFRDLFQTGWPILTYHHVGPRRRGVRIKGLFVSPKLFARQMTELKQAGFGTGSLGSFSDSSNKVWLTFDDGFLDVFEYALPVLRDHGFRAIVFLVSDLIGKTNEWQESQGDLREPLMDESQVREWLSAGQEIGSHTCTHPHLTQLPEAKAREEITASRKALEDRFGVSIEHFCYPYGDWNQKVRDLVQSAGYKTACTTDVGINTMESPRFELKRITARYPSRNLRAVVARLRGR